MPKCTGYQESVGLGRRGFLQSLGMGVGAMALADLMAADSAGAELPSAKPARLLSDPHFAPKAKRIIFLFQSGGPSQIDLFDYKSELAARHGSELPAEVRGEQRLTAMSANQSSFPLVASPFEFQRHGESGAWMSDLLPVTSLVADDLCIVKSLHTEAINHGPGVTMMQTGSQFPGRPSMGAWIDYGLGSGNANLPAFVVLVTKDKGGQPLLSRLWGNGFLPARHQGVRFRSGRDPVLYLRNPAGVDGEARRLMLDRIGELHRLQLERTGDAAIESRIEQYELAYRMQMSIPEATDTSDEPEHVFREYGSDARNPGSYAANCLLARRLAERGVRFIQLYHQGWDHHGNLPQSIRKQCRETDQATAALVNDLKRRGLLEDTLVVWGGEFGRTNYSQGKVAAGRFGRDHHPRCFTMWLAGGGVKPGISYGETDPFSYNVAANPVHVHDLQATILHLLGIDHERLTFRYQGRDFRLTDIHGHVVRDILA
ncbi:MAG: DUF1501 domain-containing protein [Planctomycetota bacterium]|nr:MAG: DUF1501 domain-containing protein [Planctomycetota bacterium]REJ93173.1 MAG: DUF1501 domain-containing protein [Planctomycetota bacterium]REK23358.1 MAG: DUF1501 domain-containing protein [Planctomycetota bacterium]REK47161.1 MAG: DUF1501 domain-containing protein [Planctomycetota bacterium]